MFGPVNAKQAEYLDDILSSGNHLLSLINDVLDLSKVEAGQVELEVAPFSLREALERGVVMVRERATEDGVQVELSAGPEVDVVEGDERRIKQVIFNLLSNAVKFTPAGGAVDVSAAQVNGEVRVSVADTGPGIAPEDHERIFEEFQQTEAGVEQREGTGLGLALSKRLVELHGGRIWVDSEPWERVAPSPSRCPRGGRSMAGERILVVEDNEKNMKLFRDVLESSGIPHARGDDRRARRSSSRSSRRPTSCSWTSSSRTSTASRRSAGCARTAGLHPCRCSLSPRRRWRETASGSWRPGFDGYLSKPVERRRARSPPFGSALRGTRR